MGPKKKSKIILIVIILLVILTAILGITYIALATDAFKSNKELFFKYVAQMGDEKEGFIEPQLKQYFEKQKSTPYSNEGKFTLNKEKQKEASNDFDIVFVGKTDKTKEATEQEISINYSNEVTFPINYRKVGNTIGLQTKYVSNKYIAVETDKLEDTAYKELEGIEGLQNNTQKLEELTQLPFSKEEGKQIQENIQKILNEKLQDDQFAKIEEGNSKGYKISIEGKQIKEIIIQILETLKNDEPTLEKLNEYVKKQKNSAKITASVIDNYIKELEENSTIEEETCEISVFQEKGKTNQLVIKQADGVEIKIEKQKTEESVQYTISILVEESQLILRANYKGLDQLQNVTENYEVELQIQPSAEMQVLEKATQNKSKNRIQDEKEKVMLLIASAIADSRLNGNSTLTIEDIEKEIDNDSSNFYKNMEIKAESGEKIIIAFTDTKDEFEIDASGNITKEPEQIASDNETNNSSNQSSKITYKYQYNNQLNFENTVDIEEFSDNNAMILNNYEEEQVSNFLAQVADRVKQVNQKQMEELGLQENENPLIQLVESLFEIAQYTQSINAIQGTETRSELQEAEINAFNAKFEAYESTNLKGVTVKGLLTTIGRNNETQKDEPDRQIKEIHFDGEEYEVTEQNILLLKSTVETETAYRVEFERDEQTGIIYRVVINKK